MTDPMRRFAARLANLERRQRGAATGPQLAHSSIEAGSIDEYDVDGVLVGSVGEQFDGTHGAVTLNGPKPPMPSDPEVEGGQGVLTVAWDGFFADLAGRPLDLDFTRVRAATSPDMADAATIGTLAASGAVTVARPEGTYWVDLVAESKPGLQSAPTVPVETIVDPTVDVGAIEQEITDANTRITEAKAELEAANQQLAEALAASDTDQAALATTVSTLKNTTIPQLSTDLTAAEGRLETAEQDLSDAFTSINAVPGQISTAKSEAITAAAADAKTKADAAAAVARKALESARSFINPGTALTGLGWGGPALTLADSPTAMGGKALRKTGAGGPYWWDKSLIIPVDPNVLYRVSMRVRVVAPTTTTDGSGKAFYLGAYGYADAAGAVMVNANGLNQSGSQHWVVSGAFPATTDSPWVDYVGYIKGYAAINSTGAGTLSNPRTFHPSAKYFGAGAILDFQNGNGTWEVSHWSIDAIDAIGHQALLDAASARARAEEVKTEAAADAKTKADAAAALANTAQAAADQAKADALAAAGLAGSKGEIIFQATAPTGARATELNLWIRSSDNKPHRWNPASTLVNKWEAITDQAAVNAAAAAAAAQTAAGNAATAAQTAQDRADAAHSLATTAKSTADTALTSANGKNRIFKTLSDPPAGGNGAGHGDVHWKYADNTYSTVVGEWWWDSATTTWKPQKLSHQTIASVDLGALVVAGTATISSAVAQKIAAGTATIQQADIGHLTVTGTTNLATAVAQRIAANTGQFISLAVSQLTVGAGSMAVGVIDKLFADVVKARIVTSDAFIGENAILTGAITASKITASEELTAKVAQFLKVKAGQIDVNELWADASWLGKANAQVLTLLSNTDGSGYTSEVRPEGFRIFYTDPETGEQQERITLGTFNGTSDYFGLTDDNNQLSVSIDKDGGISGRALSAEDSFTYKGEELQEILNGMPWGLVAQTQRTTDAVNVAGILTRVPFLRLTFPQKAGRNYEITTSPIGVNVDGTSSQRHAEINLHYKADGNDCSVNDPIISQGLTASNGTPYFQTGTPLTRDIRPGTFDRISSVLISFRAQGAGSTARLKGVGADTVTLTIKDTGPTVQATGEYLDGPATIGATQPPPPPAKQTYILDFPHAAVRSFQGNNTGYLIGSGKGYQGLSPAGYGNLKSLFTFPSVIGHLSGSSVEAIYAKFYFEHWYYGSGGTARIGLHGASTMPDTFTASVTPVVSKSGWARASSQWVLIPSQYYEGFKSGQYRGFSLLGDGTYQTYGVATAARLKAKYTK